MAFSLPVHLSLNHLPGLYAKPLHIKTINKITTVLCSHLDMFELYTCTFWLTSSGAILQELYYVNE